MSWDSKRRETAIDALMEQGLTRNEAEEDVKAAEDREEQEQAKQRFRRGFEANSSDDETNPEPDPAPQTKKTEKPTKPKSKVAMAARSISRALVPPDTDDDPQLASKWAALNDAVDEAFGGKATDDEVRRVLRLYLRRLLRSASELQVAQQVKSMRSEARAVVCACVDRRFRHLFEPGEMSLPNQMAGGPSIFLRLDKEYERPKSNPLVLRYGNTTLHVSGTLPHARDQALLFALNQIRKRSLRRWSEWGVTFSTSLAEIAKEMRNSNPYSETVKHSVREGLRRLHDVRLTWFTDEHGEEILGGAVKARITESGTVRIEIDTLFLEMHDRGFVMIRDPDAYYSLVRRQKWSAMLLLTHLLRQRTFNSGRKQWLKDRYLNKIAHQSGLAGLRGFESKGLSDWQLRRFLNGALADLKAVGLLKGHWEFVDGKGGTMLRIADPAYDADDPEDMD